MAQLISTTSSGSNGVRSDVSGSWSAARTDNPANGVTNFVTQAATNFQCGRWFGFFDLSSIPAGSTIDSVTFTFPAVGNVTDSDSGSVDVVEHIASDPVAVGDFLNYKSLNSDVSFGNVDVTNLNTGSTTDVTINATGITYIEAQVGGTAKIGLRSSEDFGNSAPSGNSQYTMSVTGVTLTINYTLSFTPTVTIF